MSEPKTETVPFKVKRIGRRRFLGLMGGAAVTAVAVACEKSPAGQAVQRFVGDGDTSSLPLAAQAAEAPEHVMSKQEREVGLSPQTRAWRDEGREMRSDKDKKDLNETQPGVDLTYSESEGAAKVRAIRDPIEKTIVAIGFLAVEESKRYQWKRDGKNIYTCNTFFSDLAVLTLGGHKDAGSRYKKATGEPWVAGINSDFWQNIEEADEYYPYLHSNILDWWMGKYGKQHGWEQINTKADLRDRLRNGHIGFGFTTYEEVQANYGKEFYGHAFNVSYPDGEFLVTQSTRNKELVKVVDDSPQTTPEQGVFHFWVHELP